jgi:hypothetical protein
LLKRPKTSKYFFEIFQIFKNGKSGGLANHNNIINEQGAETLKTMLSRADAIYIFTSRRVSKRHRTFPSSQEIDAKTDPSPPEHP